MSLKTETYLICDRCEKALEKGYSHTTDVRYHYFYTHPHNGDEHLGSDKLYEFCMDCKPKLMTLLKTFIQNKE
jgi:hypothetical protein